MADSNTVQGGRSPVTTSTQPSFGQGTNLSGTVTNTSGPPQPGNSFSFSAKTTASGGNTDDILWSVLGSASGDIYTVKRMNGLGSATVSDSTTLPTSSAGKSLVWVAEPTYTASQARSAFKNRASSGNVAAIGTIGSSTGSGSSVSASNVMATGCPSPGTLAPSKSGTLDVTVSNQNSAAASVTVQLVTQSGLDLGSATKTISANSSQTVSVSYTAPSSEGNYDLSVNVASVSAA